MIKNEKRLIDARDAQKVKESLAMCCKQVTATECAKCVYHEYEGGFCIDALMNDARVLINQQKAEIDRLIAERKNNG